jgi:excisionase family DNA binding protein
MSRYPVRVPPEMMTVSEVSQRTGLSEDSVRKGIANRQLPGQHVGERYAIPREWFERWLRGEPTVTAAPQADDPIRLVRRVDLRRW